MLSQDTAKPGSANPLRRFARMLGPGLITGASDDDPSGTGTYATAGATFGYATLWTAPLTVPLMIAVQFICAKIGMVSGVGLAHNVRELFPAWVLYPVVLALFVANTINAGADIVAVAAGINLLTPLPISVLVVPIGLFVLGLQVFGSYRLLTSVFKWLTLALFAYIASSVLAQPDWGQVLWHTLVPTVRFEADFLATLVAVLGTTISPYLFFWQTSEEVEEEVQEGRTRLRERRGASRRELREAGWDTTIGMAFSNAVFYFVVLGTASTLHVSGQTEVESAAQAAEALRPLAGDAATVLFAIGIIGAGFLAIPILTGAAAYAVADTFGWKEGMDADPTHAPQFYAVIAVSTLVGLLIGFFGINPISALFWTAVINGFLAPPMLVLIMLIANDRRVMGERVNGRLLNVVGWTTTVVMFAAAGALVMTWTQAG